MIICKKCGRGLANDAKFCDRCGTPVTQNVKLEKEPLSTGTADDELKKAEESAEAEKKVLTSSAVNTREESKTDDKKDEKDEKNVRHENGFSNPAKENLKDYFTDESVAALGGDALEPEDEKKPKSHSAGISRARLITIEVIAIAAAIAFGVSSVVIFSSKVKDSGDHRSIANVPTLDESSVALTDDTIEETETETETTEKETKKKKTTTTAETTAETETTTTETETETKELISELYVPARIDFTQGYVSNPNGTTFRYGPGMNYAEKDFLKANQAVWMINYQDGWYFVEYYGIDGWIPASAWTEGPGGDYDYSLFGYGNYGGYDYSYGDDSYNNNYNYNYNYDGSGNGGQSATTQPAAPSKKTTTAPPKKSTTKNTKATTAKAAKPTTKKSETKATRPTKPIETDPVSESGAQSSQSSNQSSTATSTETSK